MTVTGIIAEFNPFHNGHKYLLEQASGLKIIAMSGNFVQRGEPAIGGSRHLREVGSRTANFWD